MIAWPKIPTVLRDDLLRGAAVFAVLAGVITLNLASAEHARSSGDEIILETRPIDPRDIFFGHYATLGYGFRDELQQAVDVTPDGHLQAALSEDIAALKAAFNAEDHRSDVVRRRGETLEILIDVTLRREGPFHAVQSVALVDEDTPQRAAENSDTLIWRLPATTSALVQWVDGTVTSTEYEIDPAIALPSRYYADPETALALEDVNRAARRFRASEREYERCLRDQERRNDPQAVAARSDEEPEACTPPEASEPKPQFGVILSTHDGREPVIRGLYINGTRYIDTLNGPRLVLEREDLDAEAG